MIFFFTVLSAVYLLFLIWLCFGLKEKSESISPQKQSKKSSISVIVAARNEEKNISRLLDCLIHQTYSEGYLEIIVANDNSSDSTGEIVNRFSLNYSFIQHLQINDTPSDWSPKMWALSQGVQASNGEILFFTDADCIMDPGWINSMTTFFRNSEVGMVAGPSPLEKGNSLWDRMLLLDSIGQDALAAGGFSRGIPLTSCGRNRAIRRTAYDSIHGYEDIRSFFSGDDDLMMHRIHNAGWKIMFCLKPSAKVKSAPPSGLFAFLKQRLRFASKGKTYYNLPFVEGMFKLILLLVFLTNLGVIFGMIGFISTFKSAWLLPWFLKMMGDGILISRYNSIMDRFLDPRIFLLCELWHSFYVILLGAVGSFLPISWKGRKRSLQIT